MTRILERKRRCVGDPVNLDGLLDQLRALILQAGSRRFGR